MRCLNSAAIIKRLFCLVGGRVSSLQVCVLACVFSIVVCLCASGLVLLFSVSLCFTCFVVGFRFLLGLCAPWCVGVGVVNLFEQMDEVRDNPRVHTKRKQRDKHMDILTKIHLHIPASSNHIVCCVCPNSRDPSSGQFQFTSTYSVHVDDSKSPEEMMPDRKYTRTVPAVGFTLWTNACVTPRRNDCVSLKVGVSEIAQEKGSERAVLPVQYSHHANSLDPAADEATPRPSASPRRARDDVRWQDVDVPSSL